MVDFLHGIKMIEVNDGTRPIRTVATVNEVDDLLQEILDCLKENLACSKRRKPFLPISAQDTSDFGCFLPNLTE